MIDIHHKKKKGYSVVVPGMKFHFLGCIKYLEDLQVIRTATAMILLQKTCHQDEDKRAAHFNLHCPFLCSSLYSGNF